MRKKLMLACMAIAAFAAFVFAPAASATTLTENKVPVAVGASIKATNTGNTLFTTNAGITVECTHAELRGTVTVNNNTTVAGTIKENEYTFSGAGTNGDCVAGSLGSIKPTIVGELCLETIAKTDEVTIDGCLVAGVTKPVVFTLDSTLGFNCKYSVPTLKGTYTTESTGDATVNLNKAGTAKLVEGGFACPTEGTLDMDFDLTTTDGTTLTFS